MKWNAWSLVWLAWLVEFLCIELTALATGHPENTFSYQVWHLEGAGATFARWFVASFFGWLFVHMVFEKFR